MPYQRFSRFVHTAPIKIINTAKGVILTSLACKLEHTQVLENILGIRLLRDEQVCFTWAG